MSATYPLLFIWGNAVFKYLKWSVPSIKDGSWYGCIFSQAMRDERLLIPTLSAAAAAATAAKCPNLCDPIDGSPPGSAIPGILQARTLEWVAISFSKAWKWKVKVKFLSHVRLLATPWTAAYQAPPSMGFFRQKYWSGVPLPSPTLSESQFRKRNKWVFDHLKEIKFFPWKLKEFISMNSQGQSWIFDFNFFFFLLVAWCLQWCYSAAAVAAAAKSLQSCLTLCDLIDGSSPGSAVPGILQARTLEWVAISFSNDATLQSISEPIDMCGPHYSLFMFVFMIATTKNVLIGNARPFFFMFLYKRGFSLPSKHGEC